MDVYLPTAMLREWSNANDLQVPCYPWELFLASVIKYRIYSMLVIQLERGIEQEGIATKKQNHSKTRALLLGALFIFDPFIFNIHLLRSVLSRSK